MAKDRGGARPGARETGEEPELDVEQMDPEEVVTEDEGAGLAGSGRGVSGTLPGSVGGTTGVGGENAGISSPGSDVPSFPGISPDEAEKLKHKRK